MLMWNPSKLTNDGKALLAKCQAGKCNIKITKAMTGAGTYTEHESLEVRTALKDPKQTFPIQSMELSTATNTVIVKVAMTNKLSDQTLSVGYEMKEFGIFANDPDKGEILYSIATAKTSDYMPAYNGEIASVIKMSYYLEVSNAANVTINSAGAVALQSDLEALETRVLTLEQSTMKRYGARRRKGDDSCKGWERIGAAKGLVAEAAKGNGAVRNDFMKFVYPYNKCRPCNLAKDLTVNAYMGDADFQWDGTNGDVMLEMPVTYTDRYYETDENGVEWEYRWVSEGPVGGCHVHPAFIDGGKVSDKIYIPIFNGSLSSDTLSIESKAGAFPLYNKNRDQFRKLCTAKGAGWALDDVWNMHLLDTLFIVMFANTNAQGILGAGRTGMTFDKVGGAALQTKASVNYICIKTSCANTFSIGEGVSIGTSDTWSIGVAADRRITRIEPSVEVPEASNVYFDGDPVSITEGNVLWSCCQPTGATVGMASANGCVEGKSGRAAVRFLYIEDWFGNGWQFRDGDNISHWQHYYCNKRASYADKVLNGDYFMVGYLAAKENGYVSEMGYDKAHPEIEIATGVLGSSASGFADYYYQADGGEVVLSGGSVGYGPSAGPFFRHCDNGAGNSYLSILGRPQARKIPF